MAMRIHYNLPGTEAAAEDPESEVQEAILEHFTQPLGEVPEVPWVMVSSAGYKPCARHMS